MNPLVQLILQQIPGIIADIKTARAASGAPTPTSEDVIAAFDQLFSDDVAKDEALKIALQAEIDAGQ